MSDAEHAGLFQEFYRVKSHKTSGIAGTGPRPGHGEARARRIRGEDHGPLEAGGKGTSTIDATFPKAPATPATRTVVLGFTAPE